MTSLPRPHPPFRTPALNPVQEKEESARRGKAGDGSGRGKRKQMSKAFLEDGADGSDGDGQGVSLRKLKADVRSGRRVQGQDDDDDDDDESEEERIRRSESRRKPAPGRKGRKADSESSESSSSPSSGDDDGSDGDNKGGSGGRLARLAAPRALARFRVPLPAGLCWGPYGGVVVWLGLR